MAALGAHGPFGASVPVRRPPAVAARRPPERTVRHIGHHLLILSAPRLELLRGKDTVHVLNELRPLLGFDLPQLVPTSAARLQPFGEQLLDLLGLLVG
jgi:hypothetical protein